MREAAAKYREKNREKIKEKRRQDRRENPKKHREAVRAYARRNAKKVRERARRRREEAPEKVAEIHWKSKLRTQYGISVEEYGRLLKKQRGRCAICRCEETSMYRGKVRRLAVDHCHKTGKVRGLLCMGCNQGIGKFQDSLRLLRRAMSYLEASA